MSWIAGLVVVIAAVACQPPKSAELSEQDITALKGISGKWTKAQVASDWSAMESLFADNVALFPANMAPVQGKEAVMTFLKGFPKLSAFTATPAEVGGSGDVSYDRGTYSFTTAAAPNAPSMTETGIYLAISKRQADGTWKVMRDIWHSDSPAPAPAPALAKKK
jgi:ketosteroid isomerase-like protein